MKPASIGAWPTISTKVAMRSKPTRAEYLSHDHVFKRRASDADAEFYDRAVELTRGELLQIQGFPSDYPIAAPGIYCKCCGLCKRAARFVDKGSQQIGQSLPPPLAEHGCDGWRWGTTDADARVVLLDPSALLRLVDDDKQSGLAQMTLTDMFTRSFSRGCSVSASPAASSSMDP